MKGRRYFKHYIGTASKPEFVKDHDLFYAWQWILEHADWKGENRGKITGSERTLAVEWGVCNSKARRMLGWFEEQGMISIDRAGRTGKSVISITNWDKYQASEALSEAPSEAPQMACVSQKLNTREAPSEALSEAQNGVSSLINIYRNNIELDTNVSNIEGNNSTTKNTPSDASLPKINDRRSSEASNDLRNEGIEKPKKRKEPERHRYGRYGHVLLSDEELENFKVQRKDDWEQIIDELDGYCEAKGKSYKKFKAALENWARRKDEWNRPSKPNNTPTPDINFDSIEQLMKEN